MKSINQKITPHFWYDKEAKEATRLYTSIFPNSRISHVTTIHNPPPYGDADLVTFTLSSQEFMAINGGPIFKLNPSISLSVKFKSKEKLDQTWQRLSAGGKVLMDLGTYPWSERYGWLEDSYGLSWQLIYVGKAKITQRITPILMYVGDVAGKAEEAINHYISVFRNGSIGQISRYGKGEAPDAEGTVKQASFTIFGQEFDAMDSAYAHQFAFNEAFSLLVNCENQEEIDYLWESLSAFPDAEACGWLKDKFGVSWQIVPSVMNDMMVNGTYEQVTRLTEAVLPMKKLVIADLIEAYKGK